MRAFLSTLGILVFAASASAATLKVPQQYGTIQEALDAAADGDTILVSKGVYYETVSVEMPNLRIIGKKAVIDGTFAGGPALQVLTVDPVSYYPCMGLYASGVTVQGFTFRNGSDHVQVYAPDCRILKCISKNAGNDGIHAPVSRGLEVSGCRIVGAGYHGIYAAGTGSSSTYSKNQVRQAGVYGMYVAGSSGAVLDRNVVANVQGESGIYVAGSSASITGNRVSNTGFDGISVYGSNATVVGNRASWSSRGSGIHVDGNGALLQGNTATVANGSLFICAGSGNRVVDNKGSVALGFGAGFNIGGDDLTVSGNIAQQIAEYGSGFNIYNYSPAGGSLIEGNTAEDASGGGFYFRLYGGATVRDCSAVRCGFQGFKGGFLVYGGGATYENCSATDCHGDGFYVSASGSTFTGCTAMDSTINGFLVYGDGNTFTSCTAKGTGGQGFHNGGTNTRLEGGVYLDNRIDIANEVSNMATFIGGLGGVVHETGSETTEPEVYAWK